MSNRELLRQFDKETLIDMLEDASKNWLAHDGVWFQAVERKYGLETAIKLDAEAWERFTAIEARRIMKRHNIPEGGGLDALRKALAFRMYAHINVQEIIEVDEQTIRFQMNDCRVQSTRKRKGLPDFPCKSVGIVEYEGFARAIDPRIETMCIACPPDPHPDEFWCAWEFSLVEQPA